MSKTGWVTEADSLYHNTPALSSHGIKTILKSPLHFHSEYVLGVKLEPSPAMQLGTLLHAAVLEPETFRSRFRVPPKCDRRTKEGKAVYEAFTASLQPNQVVVSDEDAATLHGVAESLSRHELARKLLTGGVAEQSGYAVHDDIPVKIRPDYRHPKTALVDLKFVYDASYKEFQRIIPKYGYDVQAAWYLTLTAQLDECDVSDLDFVWVAVEKTPPYAVAIYEASPTLVMHALHKIKRAIALYKECNTRNVWPGYSTTVQQMDLPRWALND